MTHTTRNDARTRTQATWPVVLTVALTAVAAAVPAVLPGGADAGAPDGKVPATPTPSPADGSPDGKAATPASPAPQPPAPVVPPDGNTAPVPLPDPKGDPKSDAKADPKADPAETPDGPETPRDLRDVMTGRGMRRVLPPRLPPMALKGFIRVEGRPEAALLELGDTKRVYVVRKGTRIPIMVQGRIAATQPGSGILGGLESLSKGAARPAAPAADPNETTQVVLKVTDVTAEGIIVEAGVLSQTLIIR